MEVGQRLAAIEPGAFGHEAVEQRQHAIGTIDKGVEDTLRIDAAALATLIEPGFGARGVFGRRQIGDGEVVAGDVVRAGFLEIGLALGIEEGCGGVRK